jgi:hypothetical protein
LGRRFEYFTFVVILVLHLGLPVESQTLELIYPQPSGTIFPQANTELGVILPDSVKQKINEFLSA